MTTRRLKRKLAAILGAGVKDYGHLRGKYEETANRTLNAYREMMGAFIQTNGEG